MLACIKQFAQRSRCTVTIAGEKIISPSGTIQKGEIFSWTQDGEGSKGDTGMKAASFLGFRLLSLVAASGVKTHDYSFDIPYIDNSGNIHIISFKLKTDAPVNRISMKLIGLTGLTMG